MHTGYLLQKLKTNTVEKNITIFLVFLVFLVFYTPLFFEDFRFLNIHDNLDSEVVINKLIADYYKNIGEFGESAPLNGNLEFNALSRAYQPLTLLYALLPNFEAYVLTDLIVRLTAFFGMFLFIKELNKNLNPKINTLLSLIFSFSISYSVYLFSIAGLPAIFFLIKTIENRNNIQKKISIALLFIIGLNISFPLTGIFLLAIIIPIIKYLLDCKITYSRKLCLVFLFFGIFLGNSNIFYVQLFTNEPWHRVEFSKFWIKDGVTLKSIADEAYSTIKGIYFYHVSYPIGIVAFSSFLFLFLKETYKDKRILFMYFMVFVILLTYLMNKSLFMQEIENRIKFLQYFNWSRLYFFYSFFIICMAGILFSKINKNANLIIALLIYQLILILHETPHIFNAIENDKQAKTFENHFMFDDYSEIKKIVRDSAVLSVGIDPMIAPMNNIKSIDGYYPLYPLSYKHEFSKVISQSIVDYGNPDYYYSWGNRIYTFHIPGKESSINFCEAYKIGASFVISSKTIKDNRLLNVWKSTSNDNLHLYKINNEICN